MTETSDHRAVGLWLSIEVHEWLKENAKLRGISVSQQAREYLEHQYRKSQ